MGRKLNKAYGRPPNIYRADEDTIVYRYMPNPLAKLQLLAKGVIAEAEEALNELTLGGPLPDIDLSLIAGPLISTSEIRKRGYSLFHNEYPETQDVGSDAQELRLRTGSCHRKRAMIACISPDRAKKDVYTMGLCVRLWRL
ncbi:hypothetical protein VE03_10342 [Pseudogymnoascus sp. 23342-1-I1]|nr:hypothetical protein VE03_10342 [Pseudogymnoascus sp. 23342-1-I1]